MIKIVVYGPPSYLQESCAIRGRIVDLQKSEKIETKRCFQGQYKGEPLKGPLHAKISFFMPMPYDATLKKKDKLRYQPHDLKVTVHDMCKFYLVCGNDIIFQDVTQIAQIEATKTWSDDPKTVIIIQPATIEDL